MRAYLTLLSTDDYLPGVLCLARSLADTGTTHPLYVALSAGVSRRVEPVLAAHGLRPLRLPAESLVRAPEGQQAHHWSRTFDKLHLFGLVQFSKFVYLDSDMLVLANIDELFEQPHMSAVAAGSLVHPDWIRLNSGLMVVEPEAGLPTRIAAAFETALAQAATDRRQAIGDQDLINAYYAEWPRAGLNLDEGYNVFHPYVDAYVDSGRYALPPAQGGPDGNVRPIKVVHFIGPVKPWSARGIAHHLRNWLFQRRRPVQHATFIRYCAVMARRGRPLRHA